MSDEDRLRESLHRQVADVPALDDLDDVAARIGGGRSDASGASSRS